jgi:tRNA 2-selenouridine synthase
VDAWSKSNRSRSGGTELVVLAGLAGTGKTALLHSLRAAGEHVLDLEALAGHRGSAYGGLGLPPQPPQAVFDHAVFSASVAGRVWIEDEGAFVGSLTVPAWLRARVQAAPMLLIEAPLEERIARLVTDYGGFEPRLLIRATQRIRRRLGGPIADRAISHFGRGHPDAAIAALLPYFDAAYRHRWSRLWPDKGSALRPW